MENQIKTIRFKDDFIERALVHIEKAIDDRPVETHKSANLSIAKKVLESVNIDVDEYDIANVKKALNTCAADYELAETESDLETKDEIEELICDIEYDEAFEYNE